MGSPERKGMPSLAWFRRRRSTVKKSDTRCQGIVEVITPTRVSGWLYEPDGLFREVRLISGTQLIASGPIDGDRPDVAAHLGKSGRFGFDLEIMDSRPDPLPDQPLRVIALTADGSSRFELQLQGVNAPNTSSQLHLALLPERRGLRGHFDGLSADGRALCGWCYSRNQASSVVWLHAEGLPPRPVHCTTHRPGMVSQGHVDHCGFVLPLSQWPEAAGRMVWASFDQAGELRLPPATPVALPKLDQPVAVEVSPPTAAPVNAPVTLMPMPSPDAKNIPEDLQAHWQALEEFRELIDQLESQVVKAENDVYEEVVSAARAKPALRRRSPLFRLWR